MLNREGRLIKKLELWMGGLLEWRGWGGARLSLKETEEAKSVSIEIARSII